MVTMLTVLGMNHELQHQAFTIPKSAGSLLSTVGLTQLPASSTEQLPLEWHRFDEEMVEIGHQGNGFSCDHESPRHK